MKQSSVWDSSWYTVYVRRRSLCQQMAARLLLFIKFGPSVDHGESTSAGKIFLDTSNEPFFLGSTYPKRHRQLDIVLCEVLQQDIHNTICWKTRPDPIRFLEIQGQRNMLNDLTGIHNKIYQTNYSVPLTNCQGEVKRGKELFRLKKIETYQKHVMCSFGWTLIWTGQLVKKFMG